MKAGSMTHPTGLTLPLFINQTLLATEWQEWPKLPGLKKYQRLQGSLGQKVYSESEC